MPLPTGLDSNATEIPYSLHFLSPQPLRTGERSTVLPRGVVPSAPWHRRTVGTTNRQTAAASFVGSGLSALSGRLTTHGGTQMPQS
jgi:hypothetical protein